MERYCLIDVSNTKGTVKGVLDFSLDWHKLLKLLKGEKWQCKQVIYYEGAMETKQYEKKRLKLETMGYEVFTKQTFFHKNKDKVIKFDCKGCKAKNNQSHKKAQFSCDTCSALNPVDIITGDHPKANFDVEIAVDALEFARPGTEVLLFTGDGDFKYLADKLVAKGALVTFVSSMKTTSEIKRRFSTRLQDLITEEERRASQIKEPPRVRLLELDNWKNLIKKDVIV